MADEFDNQATANAIIGVENSTEVDERVATMLHLQQLQHKHMESQSVTHADAEFRRGLEELVRDHLNTCMVLAGSSSSSNILDHANDECHLCHYHSPRRRDDGQVQHGNNQVFQTGSSEYCNGQYHLHDEQGEEEVGNDQLVRGRGHLVRRQASILSRWAVCHAQEMITTMERQARETELLALAGLHAVSMLDASFLREPSRRSEPTVAMENSVERSRRTSSLVQMWRELEERRAERARTGFDGRVAFRAASGNFPENTGELGNNHQTYNTDEVLELGINHAPREELQHQAQETDHSEDSLRGAVNLDSLNNAWDFNERNAREELQGRGQELEREALPMNGSEREPVRQIVQRLSTENGMRDGLSNTVQNDNRNLLLGENERERVRELAREWVRVTSQQSTDALEGRRSTPEINELQSGNVRRQAREREAVLEGATSADLEPNTRDRFSRDAQWLRDRQAVLDLLVRIERERQNELQGLLEHRAVSDFAHRNRLQSFLRGRFLRNGTTNEEEEPTSSAARELGQLRQRRAVSGLREGFRFRLETILRNQVNNRFSESRTTTQDEVQRRVATQQVTELTGEPNDVENSEIPPDDVSRDWQGIAAARRVSELQSLEEATAYNMELQELLGRRSVSNLLASEFRDRLDQLIRSFLHSQGRTQVTWDFTRSGRTAAAPQQQQQQQQQQQLPPPPPPLPQRQPQQQQTQVQTPSDEGMENAAEAAAFTEPPPPPPPPPQPLWQQELQHTTWARPAFQRPSFMEWENMNELRADVGKLQQGMSDLQRMMETCMEMQLEIQRAVRQEVAGALQQIYTGKVVPEEAIDGSKWVTVKKGICCVCCDKNIDSLLYRCGHMCTCLKCASELLRNSGKCPMCRAPIVEVVRAFTVA